jgi:hypothetical protein
MAGEPNAQSARLGGWTVFAGVVTLALAIVGAVTGTLSFLEDRNVAVSLSAQPYLGLHLDQGLIRFSIINQSRHALAIQSGDVLLQGRKIGSLTSLSTDLRSVDLYSRPSPDLDRRAQLLPFGVGAETTTTVAATWNLDERGSFALDALQEANTLDATVRDPIRPSPTRLELRLHLVPGDERMVRVPVLAAHDIEPHRDSGIAAGWGVRLALRRHVVTDMRVTTSYDLRRELTLKVWTRTSSSPIRTLRRPLGPGVGRFALRWLRRGTYVWALDDGQSVVGVGTLVQPCPHPGVAASEAVADVFSDACSLPRQRSVRQRLRLDRAVSALRKRFARAAQSRQGRRSLPRLRKQFELKLRELLSKGTP